MALLILAFASPAAAHPCPSAPPKAAPKKASAKSGASAEQVLQLYQRTALALRSAHDADATATEPLFLRFRYVNINDAIRTPDKRTAAVVLLEKIAADAKKIAP